MITATAPWNLTSWNSRYYKHMGYINSSDRMANSCSMSRHTFKWTTKLFFHLLDLTVLNSWLFLPSCGAKYTHQDFRLLLVKNLIEEAEKAKIIPPPDWVEDQVWLQQMCVLRAAITSNGHWNHPPNSTAVSVHLAAIERAQCVSTPDVMLACAWCLVSQNITPE